MKRRAKGDGCILKLKGCRFWYLQFFNSAGRKVRISSKTEDRQNALDQLRKYTADKDAGSAAVDAKRITYAELRSALLASYNERGNKSLLTTADGAETVPGLPQLDQFLGFDSANPGPTVAHLGTETARRFIKQRQEEGAGNAVINRSLAALRRMLNLAKREGRIASVPFIPMLKEPPARKRFLAVDDFERLLKLLPGHLRPLVAFLYWCGVRLGEALQVEWPQVDLERGLIRLEEDQTKSGEAREVPIPAPLRPVLEDAQQKEGRVFDATNLRKEWCKACAAAGLGTLTTVEGKPYDPVYSGLTIHDLRRSAVRNLVNAGVPQTVAMSISGHKTVSVFLRYAITSPADKLAAMRAVESSSLIRSRSGKKRPRKSLKPAKTAGLLA